MDWNNPTVKEHIVLPFGLTKALQAFLRLTAAIKGKMFSYRFEFKYETDY